VRLQFDGLDDDQKAMMKMLRDTCLKDSGAEEGKCTSVRSHVSVLSYMQQYFLNINYV
jgi:hypothetical protein